MLQPNEQEISLIIKSEADIGNLYIGDDKSLEEENLELYSIGAVLSVQNYSNVELKNRTLKQIMIEDTQDFKISQYFKDCHEFIEKNIRITNVLIHCKTGRSNSAAFAISYLICTRHWIYDSAFQYVQKKRQQIDINPGFQVQLEYYADQFYIMNKSEISLILQNNQSKEKGNLYLGSIHSLDFIQKFKIGAVISLMTEFTPKIGKAKHLNLVYGDMPRVQICQAFKQTNQFISENLQETNVLVHCMGGISRSATIVIAFLMFSQKIPYDDAFKYVLNKRPFINPNEGFVTQLRKYQEW